MLISKKDITAPSLPEEVVSVQALNGDVIVRSLSLSERLSLARSPVMNGEDVPNQFGHLASLLAFCVLDAERQPLFTDAQWEAWGASHSKETLELWDIAWRLSDLDGKEAEKNSKAPTLDSQ